MKTFRNLLGKDRVVWLTYSRTALTLILLCAAPQLEAADCAPSPLGMVGWWQGETDYTDIIGTNNGAPLGNVTFGPGKVGQAFVLDGAGDGVNLGNPVALQLQTITIECWIKRASSTVVSFGSGGHGTLLSAGDGGYFFWLDSSSMLHFNRFGDAAGLNGPQITDTAFHHVAVTKSPTTVVFYLDGQPSAPIAYSGAFTFTSSINIGRHPGGDYGFYGTIDELSIYARDLSAAEIQAIYAAGNAGKCFTPTPPVLLTEPVSQTVFAGSLASFKALAGGTPPLGYQWSLNGTNLAGETGADLLLVTVNENDAGNYAVTVTNAAGSVTSSNALLTVLPALPCVAAPTGLVAWWRAQGNAIDEVSAATGTLVGNATNGAGLSGTGFIFDGAGDGISLGALPQLYLQHFTIEAWIKRASTNAASAANNGHGTIFSSGGGGYFFWMDTSGYLRFNRFGDSSSLTGPPINDTSFHHVAVTKSGTAVFFFVDGQASSAYYLNTTFNTTSGVGIGFRPDGSDYSFLGTIDELGFYNRALTTNEIQLIHASNSGGKCGGPFSPFIVIHPTNMNAKLGSNLTFTVIAGGTPSFNYQWTFNGTNISGATSSSLVITNVQFSHAGTYAVSVSNSLGLVTSSNAVLTISFPPAAISIASATVMGGAPLIVPMQIAANGNENALQFSVSYSPSLLSFAGASVSTNHSEATLFINTSQTNLGRVGCILGLPLGKTLKPGQKQLIYLTFNTPFRSSPISTSLGFVDSPTVRQLVDTNSFTLPASYAGASVNLLASVLEADASPRPNGDRNVTVSDWVLLGRYASRLDYPTNALEFQKADCAPRSTLGDGQIKVTDWVQAGRYAGGADSLTPIGGPTEEVSGPTGSVPTRDLSDRRLTVANGSWFSNQTGTVNVTMSGKGNEAGVGFSLQFDPARLSFISASKGTCASSATLNVNTSEASTGRLGFALALSTGTFPTGMCELVQVTLRVLPVVQPNVSSITFADAPVPREVSDATALPLVSVYDNGTATLRPIPELSIANAGGGVVVSWPDWATNFTLQCRSSYPSETWTNVATAPNLVNGSYRVILPATEPSTFYRLFKP